MDGAHTTLTGKVYDPAGKVPLEGIVVFVPNFPNELPFIGQGSPTCGACDLPTGEYTAATVTDRTGSFTLTDVPTGQNVPLVVQAGKWRRTITVPETTDCKTTVLPSTGAGQARLPRTSKEGNMPQMALLTGGDDDLGCFLRRIGIDPTEYSAPHGGGRLDIYRGLGTGDDGVAGGGTVAGPSLSNGTPGDCTTTNCPLWASKASLESYDMVLLACEGATYDPAASLDGDGGAANITAAGKQAMHDWLNEGGRLFATHFQYTWFQNGPAEFQGVATWLGPSRGTGHCDHCSIDTMSPDGQILSGWLASLGASAGLNLTNVASSVSSVGLQTRRWIYDPATGDAKSFSFDTPIGGTLDDAGTARYCGKATFLDVHAGSVPSGNLPGSCGESDLSAQEKALEFLFFDLAGCISATGPAKSPLSR